MKIVKMIGFVPSAEKVIEEAEKIGAKYILPVLPLSIIARLVELGRERGIKVLYSRMEQVYKGDCGYAYMLKEQEPGRIAVAMYRDGTCIAWRFKGIEEVVEVRLVTKPVEPPTTSKERVRDEVYVE